MVGGPVPKGGEKRQMVVLEVASVVVVKVGMVLVRVAFKLIKVALTSTSM